MSNFHEANRMKRLPPYLFTIIDEFKAKARKRGVDLIDLGMGNPDLAAPPHAIEALHESLKDHENHRYSKKSGVVETRLREAIAYWYKDRFNVVLDPDTEVLPLIGSKEGVAHLSLSFLNNDDIALVVSPTYPVHFNGVIMAGGILYNLPLKPENNYLPDIDHIDNHILSRSKLFYFSYPHNPTAATCDLAFFEKVARWAKKNNIIVGHDNAYSDIVFDGHKSPSFLQAKYARDIGIEFHTFSKSYNMPGWRVGYAVGNAEILAILEKTKSYIDYGVFRGIQSAAAAVLTGPQDCVRQTVEIYGRRIALFCEGLNSIGWEVTKPRATFYVWVRIPLKFSGLTSLEFTKLMIEETGVAAAPGTGFGECGEGYVRFAMVEPEERLKQAVERLGTLLHIQT